MGDTPPETPARWPLAVPCETTTIRGGGMKEPCDKLAVTWADPEPWLDECGSDIRPWPVCAYHARMVKVLPLHLHPSNLTERNRSCLNP